jgi:hypothetical protein
VSIAVAGCDVEGIRARWTAIVDDAMQNGSALQAFLARAGWRADLVTMETPYEAACMIASDVGTLRRWTECWVRFPSNDRLWIARALAERLDAVRVATLADIEDRGAWVRYTLRDRSRWFDLEEVIAPLLATAEQSMETAREIRP